MKDEKQMGSRSKGGIQVQKPILPKGGGTIQGMGETFAPHEFSGSASLSLPVPASPCRDFEPRITVNYSTGNGNSPFGLGWELSVPEIVRRTSKEIPKYDNDDTFLYAAADYLVPRRHPDGKPIQHEEGAYRIQAYMPRKEGGFEKIERYTNTETPSDDYWKVTSPDNVVSIFGKNNTARIFNPEDPTCIFKWLLEETYNDKGDHQIYTYQKENDDNIPDTLSELNRDHQTQAYPSAVYYGNDKPIIDGSIIAGESATPFDPGHWHFEIVFDYGTYDLSHAAQEHHTIAAGRTWPLRPDPFSDYSPGFEVRTSRLCHNILLFHRFESIDTHPVLTQVLELNYDLSPVLTRLSQARQIGYQYLKVQKAYRTESLPPLKFGYTSFEPAISGYQPHEYERLINDRERPVPQASDGPDFQLIDLYGEGVPGILYADGRTFTYREPLKVDLKHTSYAPSRPFSFPVEKHIAGTAHTLTDVTGNGKLDLMVSTPQLAGYYQLDVDAGWQDFEAFATFPSTYLYPENNSVDLTGDGVADVLLIEQDRVRMNASLREKGFATANYEERRYNLPYSMPNAPNETLFFADMIGSGLAQRVRITRSTVECWPSLGYGKFGRKVVMDQAPDFGPDFSIDRLLWADVDGSGLTDLAYLSTTHIDIYLNQSGNAFSTTPIRIPLPTSWDRLDQVSFADIRGNGSSCLVFAKTHPAPRQWYYDFNLATVTGPTNKEELRSQKPYLLNEIDNSMGATTTICYAGSTKFYLEDKAEDRPWITHLPSPVNVIETVTHLDHIANTRTTSAYRYSHGYYDGFERIFRGFGRVDRTEQATFTDLMPLASGVEAAYHPPPLLTRTWYHTGAYIEEEALLTQYRKEYWQDDPQAYLLPGTKIDYLAATPAADTLRDAHRTLHGAVLRTEVYGRDGSPWQYAPYTVSETQFQVEEIQALTGNKYSAFLLHQRQTLHYDYERNAADPRVYHDFTLELDRYGQVLESCTVTYPRRPENISGQMDTQTKDQQSRLWVSYDQSTWFNSIEADTIWENSSPLRWSASQGYLIGMPLEARSHEIRGLKPNDHGYFSLSEIRDQIKQASQKKEDRLIHWERHYHYDASEKKELKFGNVKVPALVHRIETADLNQAQLPAEFPFLPPAELDSLLQTGDPDTHGARGGYITYTEGDEADYYWDPGSAQSYHDQATFYLPKAYFDPYQYPYINWNAQSGAITQAAKTSYTYDKTRLYIRKIIDPLDNQTTVTDFDYRTIQPIAIRDLNQNTATVIWDPLGRVIATSESGTQGAKTVGFADLSTWIPPHSSPTIEEILKDPKNYLQQAASYYHYDLYAWERDRQPPQVLTLQNDNYTYINGTPTSPPPEIQRTVSYRDGLSRSLQTKVYFDGSQTVRSWDATEKKVVTGTADSCWLTSGAIRYDTKGQPIRQYEPYFSPNHTYIDEKELNELGHAATLFYDALGRDVLQRTPYGFFTKTLFGALDLVEKSPSFTGYLNQKLYGKLAAQFIPSPWSSLTYDENDSLGDSQYQPTPTANINTAAFTQAEKDKNTPFIHQEDGLGRKVQSEQLKVYKDQKDATYATFDILGDELTSADQRLHPQGLNNFVSIYSLSRERLKTVSADAGTRWTLNNVLGQPIYSRDTRGTSQYHQYDVLNRPISQYVRNQDLALYQTVIMTLYGDSRHNGTPYFKEPAQNNLRDKPTIHLDQAGLSLSPLYDIHDQPMLSARSLKSDYKEEADWNTVTEPDLAALARSMQGLQTRQACGDLTLPPGIRTLLEQEVYTTSARIDAIGRTLRSTDNDGNTQHPAYYSTNSLKSLRVIAGSQASTPTPGITGITYNAKSQRTTISYQNKTQTTYGYDPINFELTEIKSTRQKGHQIQLIQHLQYHHDPVGNVTARINHGVTATFFSNQKVEATATYTYDTLYRLTEATGREQISMWQNVQTNQNKFNKSYFDHQRPPGTDPKALQNYTQQYHYDGAGNLLRMKHIGKASSTRTTHIQKTSNRIGTSQFGITAPPRAYTYDPNGNMQTLGGCHNLNWNYRDNLHSSVVIERQNTINDAEYYTYDSAGRRVRKVHEQKTATGLIIKEVIYLGGIEARRTYTKTQTGQKPPPDWHLIRILDGDSCACIWRYRKAGTPKPGEKKAQLRYQYNDLLNSSIYELDENADIITFEEYYTYGGTSIMAAKSQTEIKTKHYQYSGKEKDDVTGLYYYGMRYYAPWLGRWTSTDPAGTIDGLNLYEFVVGNPITHVDTGGMACTQCGMQGHNRRTCTRAKSKNGEDSNQGIKRGIDVRGGNIRRDKAGIDSRKKSIEKIRKDSRRKPSPDPTTSSNQGNIVFKTSTTHPELDKIPHGNLGSLDEAPSPGHKMILFDKKGKIQKTYETNKAGGGTAGAVHQRLPSIQNTDKAKFSQHTEGRFMADLKTSKNPANLAYSSDKQKITFAMAGKLPMCGNCQKGLMNGILGLKLGSPHVEIFYSASVQQPMSSNMKINDPQNKGSLHPVVEASLSNPSSSETGSVQTVTLIHRLEKQKPLG